MRSINKLNFLIKNIISYKLDIYVLSQQNYLRLWNIWHKIYGRNFQMITYFSLMNSFGYKEGIHPCKDMLAFGNGMSCTSSRFPSTKNCPSFRPGNNWTLLQEKFHQMKLQNACSQTHTIAYCRKLNLIFNAWTRNKGMQKFVWETLFCVIHFRS